MTTCEALGPHACILAASIGYSIFAASWVFISVALVRGLLDLTSTIARFDEGRPLSPFPASGSRIAAFGVEDRIDRTSSIPAIPPVASPIPARADRVIAFGPPRKMPTRVVVR